MQYGGVIRYVRKRDKEFWFSLDKHLTFDGFLKKVRDKQGYVLSCGGTPVGILRYNLFWDGVPFCNLLYIGDKYRGRGFGKALMVNWENEMRRLGYNTVLVSTQSDESAQHFYRKIGYADCGEMSFPGQAKELFLMKQL